MKSTSLLRRGLTTAVTSVLLVTGPLGAGAASADDGGGRPVTYAEASVTRDGRMDFDSAFDVVDVDGDLLDAGNYAYAHTKGCEGCQAVAISFQIVLAQRSPSVFAPENAAVSLNEECDSCVAASGAYQFVAGGQPVQLTWSGRQQLKDIQKQVDALRKSELTGVEMVVEADGLADQVREVLRTELRSLDGSQRGHVEERRVKDKGHDDRSEERSSFDVGD